MQTHTGDYNNAPWPFECVPIGGSEDAIRLQPDGTLVAEDPELQVCAPCSTTLGPICCMHAAPSRAHKQARMFLNPAAPAPAAQVVVEGGWRNKIASPVWEGLGVPILATWNHTVPLWSLHHDYHPNNPHPDCTHTCHPRCATLFPPMPVHVLPSARPCMPSDVLWRVLS